MLKFNYIKIYAVRGSKMKKSIVFIGILFAIFILGGCSNDTDKVESKDYKKLGKFYIDNKEDIVGKDKFSGDAPNQLKTGESKQDMSEYMGDAYIKGYRTIWEYNAKKDETIDVKYSLNIESGEVGLVYINPNNQMEFLELLEDEKTDEVITKKLKVKKGNNRIKIVAKNMAYFTLSLEIHVGKIKPIASFQVYINKAKEML